MTDKNHWIETPTDPNRLYYFTLTCMHFLAGCISGLVLFVLCGLFPGDVGGKAGLSAFITVGSLVYIRRIVRFTKATVKKRFLLQNNNDIPSSCRFETVVLAA